MRTAIAALVALWTGMAVAQDAPGDFDYYVLALSWTPNWCHLEGDARGSEQCEAGLGLGFTLHGLWPQHEIGYPVECPTAIRPPSRTMTAEMADLYGSSGLAWHQWQRHGTCSGLEAVDYYAISRLAYGTVERPGILRQLDVPVTIAASVIEDAFMEANPDIEPDMLTVTCRDGAVQEVRICLTRELEPRLCGDDIVTDCSLGDALFLPMR